MVLDELLEAMLDAADGGDPILDDYDWNTHMFAYDDPSALADVYEVLLETGNYQELDEVLAGFEAQTMADLRDVLGDEEFERITRGTEFSHY